MTFRFIHAADIHLDSPLRSLALRDPDLAELIGNATRRAFSGIVDLCLTEQVDALLLAGDLYDGEQTSMKTARFLAEQIKRLHQAGVGVFIIRGNHDALSKITKELVFPDSVRLFGGRADAISIPRAPGDIPIIIHGLSFARPQATESLLTRYKAPVDGAVNIGLMHTSLDGSPRHDPYAPCSLSDLDAAGFDYWALGHIHSRSVAKGRGTVVMSGMPQGRDINESGPKSVTLVTISNDRSIHLEERATSVAQFERTAIDLTGIEDWRDAITALLHGIQQVRDAVQAEHAVIRAQLRGTTPLAWRIRRDRDLLLEEADSAFGKTWIDKIEIDCRAPGIADAMNSELGAAASASDPVVELRRFMTEDIAPSSAYQEEIATIARELLGQLPPECRGFLGGDEAGFLAALGDLIDDGAEDVLARLHAGQEVD